jgi:hypothetical protein
MSGPVHYQFKSSVSDMIDKAKWERSFFKALPSTRTMSVNPHAMSNRFQDGRNHNKFYYPGVENREREVVYVTSCCNSGTSVSVGGRKMADDSTETATALNRDLQLSRPVHRRQTTEKMGFMETENEVWLRPRRP